MPRLATDRAARNRLRSSPFATRLETATAVPPRATVAKVGPALVLAAVDVAAEAAGLEPGQGLAEARALVPELKLDPHDPDADAALLSALATACDRYTPLVALTPPDGLFLDVTGCAHLFGGEADLRSDLLARLGKAGFAARAAIAGTPGAAWAMAHYGKHPILAGEEAVPALSPLPVAALRIAPETVRLLKSLGLKRIADLSAQPRAPLAARFGPELLSRLDQAFGHADEPISPRRPLPLLMVERRLSEPIFQWDVVTAYLARLAAVLESRLQARGEGARRLTLALFHADGSVSATEAATTGPVRDAGRIAAVFAPKLEALAARLSIDSGIDLIRLAAHETTPVAAHQGDFDGRAEAEADLARLIDILTARLGADAVTRLVSGDSHIPELAGTALAAQRVRSGGQFAAAQAIIAAPDPPERPLRLFARPEPVEAIAAVPDGPPASFRWRKVRYLIARSEGPERIAAEWWQGGAVGPTRDYFRVEDEAGRRFWLYREGLYARETTQPRWYLHGLFA